MKRNARFNYIILVYLAGIVVFTMFRLAETVAYCATTEGSDDFGGLYWKALWTGFRFDTVISCYVLAVPLLLIIVGEMARIRKRWYYTIIHYLIMVLYTICFFACAADIPYFCYFFNRLDIVALSWVDSFGVMVSMIVSEPRYVIYLAVFLLVAVGWWWLGQQLFRRVLMQHINEQQSYAWSISLAVVLLGLGFLGMRGKLSKIPIRVSTAYFCSNPFLNQVGLNPVFTFIKSMGDAGKSANKLVTLIDEETAMAVAAELNTLPADSSLHPVLLPEGTNVIVVIMESMSAEKTMLGSRSSLTPCLDSIMRQSLTFTEAYSAGIHTYNGIYSTLYGQPAILSRHTMKTATITRISGLPQALAAAGYSTTYFMSHDEDYDNMRGFLYQNGFERVVGQHSYPKSEITGTWGISDHVLFDHVLEHCDSIAQRGPFFTTVMTVSDHGPYVLPKNISLKPKSKVLEQQLTEYADWSIERFMREASQRVWFENTLFVFVADHGGVIDPVYDLALSYNHVPLVFYAPGRITAQFCSQPSLQIDVAPTILGLLGLEGDDNMLGIDLLRHSRPYAYFSADDKIGVVDGEWFYLFRVKQDNESLYHYKTLSTEDFIGQEPERAAAMRRYAFGMIQTSQQMLLNNNQ